MRSTSIDIYQGIHTQDYGLIFKATMQHSKDGLFVTDNQGKVVMINRATEEMCDIKARQVLGRNVRDLVNEGFWDPAVSLPDKVLEDIGRIVAETEAELGVDKK